MKQTSLTPLPSNRAWPRDYLIRLLHVALSVNEYAFVRRATLDWLSVYSGDLPIQFLHALALWEEKRSKQVISQLRRLCQADPEFLKAQKLLNTIEESDENWGVIFALSPREFSQPKNAPIWSEKVAKARWAMKNDTTSAAQYIQEAMAHEISTPLAAVTHLRVMAANPDTPILAIRNLAEHYHATWPGCLAPVLVLADTFIKSGQSERGVGMLHKAATQDVTGQVARRLWGDAHLYQDLWLGDLRAHLDVRVPSQVGGALGWNRLPPGKSLPPREKDIPRLDNSPRVEKAPTRGGASPFPERLVSIQKELNKAAKRLGHPPISKRDGRFPMYVVCGSRRGLERKYGPKTTQLLRAEMEKLASAVREKQGWGAAVVLVDDAACMAQFGLKPVREHDAWNIKLALADLDAALAKKGLMIGALLIVGGPEVVPFHHLPNPLEDADADVPSDNPYATRDENYFVLEWQVGRLPGGAGSDPGPLLSMLRQATRYHVEDMEGKGKRAWWKAIWAWMTGLFSQSEEGVRSGEGVRSEKREIINFGYAAEAWEDVSRKVFKRIGDNEDLVTSPPYGENYEIPIPATQLGYFNLHGVEGNSPWYGQRDMRKSRAGADYPIALRPEDIEKKADAPEIVFSEACYGAHVEKRGVDDSLALKFLLCGSRVVVGSTVTSYGSVSGRLIAADLLGSDFWKYLKDGYSSGEALQKAKIALAQKMHKRQGYLDGEDQKTLISFVLYGDPLASIQNGKKIQAKTLERSQETPPLLKTVCSRCAPSDDIPVDVQQQVRMVVKRYLPGMADAHLSLSEEYESCSGEGHICPTSQLGVKSIAKNKSKHRDMPKRRVVTIQKSVNIPQNGAKSVHRHYARVTLNEAGKVIKMAVSR